MGNCFTPQKDDVDDDDEKITFKSRNVHVVTSKENWEQKISEAKEYNKVVVANFSASWCAPCKIVASLYSELSEKFPSLMFLMIDVDELTEFSTSWDIRATPTFFFLRDGQPIDKIVGANKPELEEKVVMLAESSAH